MLRTTSTFNAYECKIETHDSKCTSKQKQYIMWFNLKLYPKIIKDDNRAFPNKV